MSRQELTIRCGTYSTPLGELEISPDGVIQFQCDGNCITWSFRSDGVFDGFGVSTGTGSQGQSLIPDDIIKGLEGD